MELNRAVEQSPTARRRDLVHEVKLEPELRNSDYTVARYGLWRKLSSRAGKSGMKFLTPITLTDSRYLYETTRALNSVRRLSLLITTKWQYLDAIRYYHELRLYLEGRGEVASSACVRQCLKVIAVNLRFAKSKLRLAGHGISNPPVNPVARSRMRSPANVLRDLD